MSGVILFMGEPVVVRRDNETDAEYILRMFGPETPEPSVDTEENDKRP